MEAFNSSSCENLPANSWYCPLQLYIKKNPTTWIYLAFVIQFGSFLNLLKCTRISSPPPRPSSNGEMSQKSQSVKLIILRLIHICDDCVSGFKAVTQSLNLNTSSNLGQKSIWTLSVLQKMHLNTHLRVSIGSLFFVVTSKDFIQDCTDVGRKKKKV